MDESVLRQYIRDTLHELRADPRMMSLLRGAGIGPAHYSDNDESRQLANGWIEDTQTETGKPMSPGNRLQVVRFVAKRWPILLKRFRGDSRAAEHTLYNILDTKFSGNRE
jgi:hypothetical protein